MWGDSLDPKAGIFRRWSLKGITKLKYLWDGDHSTWLDTEDLYIITHSCNLEAICKDIIYLVLWNMVQDKKPQEDDWYTLDEPQRELPEEFYHIRHVDERERLFINVYRRLGQRVQNISGVRPVQLPS